MGNVISYCHIRKNKIRIDGKIFFEKQNSLLDDFIDEAYAEVNPNYPKFYKMDGLSKLGFLASELLLRGSQKIYPADSMAIVLSNSNASLDTDIRYWETVKSQASPSLFVYTLPNIVAGEICIRHGIKGESVFFVSEKFDPVQTANYVDLLLNNGHAQCCLAGWVDVGAEHADVFLYLAEKSEVKKDSAPKVLELYNSWNNSSPT